jgi:IS30 family transposase
MPYTSNPKLPRLRMEAVKLVKKGWTTRQAARHFGYNQSTVARWVQRVQDERIHGLAGVPTKPSRPETHPRALTPEIVQAILTERVKHGRCSEIVHADLVDQGVMVSLSSVKRTLKRHEMLRDRTKFRRKRIIVPRPPASSPGALVQMDTVHILDWTTDKRFYLYTILDVCSRWAYVELHEQLRAKIASEVVLRAQAKAGFRFVVLQTDNGPEFSVGFRHIVDSHGITLRHSRVRKPTDNAHIERFNRTIQEECFGQYPTLKAALEKDLAGYLDYYNNRRRHMGLKGYGRPAEVMQRY